jgi:endogenous inhibitor of DNA gyrase (YacG/DUF329 family)
MAQSKTQKVIGWMKGQGFVPVKQSGKKLLATRQCPKCGFNNALLFKAEKAPVYATCCLRCKKRVVREASAMPKTITEETAPTNPITAAAKGMVMGARALKKAPSIPADGMCKATKKDGERCSYKAQPGKAFCGKHLQTAQCRLF